MAIGLFTPLRLAPLLALSLSPEVEDAILRGEGAMVGAAVVQGWGLQQGEGEGAS